MAGEVGSVVSLWRYPVKSMMGEELNASAVDERGLLGDRAYALVDRATGKIASAKNPRKWKSLFDCRAAFSEPPRPGASLPPVRITLPDGATTSTDDPSMNCTLSTALGTAATLERRAPAKPSLEEYWPDIGGLAHRETVTDETIALGAPAGTFFDFAALHLLTTGTLDRLRALYPQGRFEVRRFRPNLVVTTAPGNTESPERDWGGTTLAIGASVKVAVKIPCPRA